MQQKRREPIYAIQVFGRKKTATVVAYCKRGRGLLRVNGRPLEEIEPKVVQYKLQEPLLLLKSSLVLIFVCASVVVVMLPKSMPFVKPSPRLWFLSIFSIKNKFHFWIIYEISCEINTHIEYFQFAL